MPVRSFAAAALLLALAPALASCGSDDDPGADSSSAPAPATTTTSTAASSEAASSSAPAEPKVPADAPRCASVWVAGADLPGGYKGCVQGGKYVRAEVLSCSSGQGIVRFDHRFWAVRGGTISQADDILKSEDYLDSVARCRG